MSKEKSSTNSIINKMIRIPLKFPLNLDKLTPSQRSQLKSIKANIVTEHFGFSPEIFAKQGMDLANISMYQATDSVMNMLLNKLELEISEGGDNNNLNLDEDEITKGIYRMETLLESSIDKYFDMFELFVLRNPFTFGVDSNNQPNDNLIPYVQLSHQKDLKASSKGEDIIALNEYKEELKLYEEEITKQRELACAEEYTIRKLESLQKRAEEYGYMNSAEPISTATQRLVTQLPHLQEALSKLLSTPNPTSLPNPSSTTSAIEMGPWGTTRSAYVNWAATNKVDKLPAGPREISGGGHTEDLMQTGGDGDAALNLIAALSAH